MSVLSPTLEYLKTHDILGYSATFKPFYDEGKQRVNKGLHSTIPIAKLDGSWRPDTIKSNMPGLMMRCGAKPHGSGFLVLDIDIHGGEVAEKEFMLLHKTLEPVTGCIVRTGSGGLHYYYRMPEGMDWDVERKVDSIDIGGITYNTSKNDEGRLDILGTGIGVFLPGTTYTHDGTIYDYKFIKGSSLADAKPPPAYLASALDARKKKPAAKAKKTPPTAPTPPGGLGALGALPAPAAPSRSQTPPRATEEDLKLIAALIDCITPEWIGDYDNWRNLGFCLKTITAGRGAEMFAKVARRSPRHNTDKDTQDSLALFASAADKGTFGFASLNHWAKHCSPEKHHSCFKDNYLHLLSQGNKGHSDIFATELAGSCVYDSDSKKFYLWVEHKQLWVEVNEDNITSQFMTLMPLVVKRLKAGLQPVPEGKKEGDGEASDTPLEAQHKMLLKLLRAFQNAMPEAVMKCVRDTLNPKISYQNIDAFELDKNPNLLPLANGVWNFAENRLEPYTRQHYLSKRAGRNQHHPHPVAYDAQASTADIKEAMRVWFKGNQRVIDWIQYWLGYVLTGYSSRQEFLILYGKSGGNGKSALIAGILQGDILGKDYACSMAEDALTRVGGNNDDIYYALDSRLAVVTEAGGEGRKAEEINMEALKRITGEDVISAQAKFKGKKEGVFRARVVFCCNSMPRMPQSSAQRRRTIVAEMNTQMLDKSAWDELTDEQRASGDYGLKDGAFIARLRANRSGVLNWLLEGASRFMNNPTLAPPVDVLRYTEEALAAADEERLWFFDGWTHTKGLRGETEYSEIANKFCEHFGIKVTNTSARGRFLKKIRVWLGDDNVLGDSNHGYRIRGLTER
jgi:hypothetical protein